MTAFLRRHWLRLYVAFLAVLALRIWLVDGGTVLVVIGAAGVGVALVVLSTAVVSGNEVVKHQQAYRAELPRVEQEQRALDAKEARR